MNLARDHAGRDRETTMRSILALLALGLAVASLTACEPQHQGPPSEAAELLNVSYDPTRELYEDINAAFTAQWAREHPGAGHVSIEMSHGGSGRQARAV